MTVVFMFPSQSSRYAGMIKKAVELRPALRAVLEEGSDVLGEDLAARFLTDDPDAFREKRDQRLGIFLVNHLYQRALEGAGVEARLSLGFSLGEYNHLVHIGALSFAAALPLMVRPAPADKPDPEGERAVVYRIPLAPLAEMVERAREVGLVEVGGMLSPHIHYIVGEEGAVRWVCERLKSEQPEARSLLMPVKLPLHSSLLRPIGERLAEHLQSVDLQVPRLPYLPNVLGRLVFRPDKATLIDLMARHFYQPVRWRQSIDHVLRRHPDAVFVEVGPRRALCAFFHLEKRWHPDVRYYITDDMNEHTDKYLNRIAEDLAGAGRIPFASERLRDRLGI